MFHLSCLQQDHGFQEIFRFCLHRFCKRRKVCQTCFLRFHEDHLFYCVDDEFIETILLNESQRLEKVITQIESCQQVNQTKKEEFLRIVKKQLANFRDCIQDIQQKQLNNGLDFILAQAVKSYNNLIFEELSSLIFMNFYNNQRECDLLFQIINQQYDYETEDYLQKKLFEQGKILQRRLLFKESLLMFDSILQIQIKPEYLLCKSFILINLAREDEAKKIIETAFNLAKNLGQKEYWKQYNSLYRSTQEVDVKCTMAHVLLHSGRYKECVNHLTHIDLNNIADDRYVILIEIYAYCLAQLKEYSEALKICAVGLQRLPDNDFLKQMKSQLIKLLNRNSDELLNLQEEDDRLKLLQGIYLSKEKREEEALKKFDSIKKSNDHISNYVECLKGDKLIKEKKVAEGLEILENVNFSSDPIMERYLKMQKLLALNKNTEALKIIDELLRDYPTKKYLYFSKCEILNIIQQYDRAVECLDIVIRQYPTDWRLQFVKVTFLCLGNRFNEAMTQIDRLLEMEQNFDILELKGKILAHIGEGNKALEVFNKLCSNFPNNFKGFSDRGLLLLSLNKLDNAILDFQKAQNMNQPTPDYSILYNKGIILITWKEYQKAVKLFKQILFYKKSQLYYVYSLFKDNQFKEVLTFTQNINKGQKYYSGIFSFKFIILFIQEKYQEALSIFYSLKEKYQQNFFKDRIISLIKLEYMEEALRITEQYISKQSNLELALFFKGHILEHQNNYKQALEFYNKSLNLHCFEQCMAAKVRLLNKMQQEQEALELEEAFFNIFPDENLDMGLKFKLNYELQLKTFTGALSFDLDSRKIMWELQMN